MTLIAQISAAERCYRTLYRKIITLELKPNESVSEQALARLLGVSRTPIREALLRLHVEGLVDLQSRSGVTISPIRYDAVQTAQFVREKLEIAIIEKAAAAKHRRTELRIRQAIEEQELAVFEGNTDMFFDADERMHQLYCELAGYAGVWSVIADAKKHMDRVRRLSMLNKQLDELLADHRALFAAVNDGDAVLASAILKKHLSRVIALFSDLSARFPEYFELAESPSGGGDAAQQETA